MLKSDFTSRHFCHLFDIWTSLVSLSFIYSSFALSLSSTSALLLIWILYVVNGKSQLYWVWGSNQVNQYLDTVWVFKCRGAHYQTNKKRRKTKNRANVGSCKWQTAAGRSVNVPPKKYFNPAYNKKSTTKVCLQWKVFFLFNFLKNVLFQF